MTGPTVADDDRARVASAETRAWLLRAVIGLNLCPFARAPQLRGRVRFVVTPATSTDGLLAALADELVHLTDVDEAETETTLLIHPWVLDDFDAYNDFLDAAEAVIDEAGLDGVIQLASFHPQYRFAGTRADDIGNATNRSPYPTLHLLREASVGRAVDAHPDTDAIFANNIATLESLGHDGWNTLRAACRADATRIDAD